MQIITIDQIIKAGLSLIALLVISFAFGWLYGGIIVALAV